MGRLILLAVLILPFAEIATFIWVGGHIGILGTLAGIIIAGAIGLYVLRLQGLAVMFDSRRMMARGEIPARQFADGMLLGLAGLFLLVPGFLTDLMGFALLIPPVRHAIFAYLSQNMVVVSTYQPGSGRPSGPRTIELDSDDYRND